MHNTNAEDPLRGAQMDLFPESLLHSLTHGPTPTGGVTRRVRAEEFLSCMRQEAKTRSGISSYKTVLRALRDGLSRSENSTSIRLKYLTFHAGPDLMSVKEYLLKLIKEEMFWLAGQDPTTFTDRPPFCLEHMLLPNTRN